MDVLLFKRPLSEGQRVRLHRIAAGYRQVDLAEIAGVPQHAVSSVELDHPVYPAARARILAVLGLDDAPETTP